MIGASDAADEWAFLGRRVLMVSRFPPAKDGIARYAAQLAEALGPDHEVLRLGIPLGSGDRVRALWGWLRPLRIAREARGYDDVLVHYHPSYFLGGGLASRLASYLALAIIVRMLRTTALIHEPDDLLPDWFGPRGRAVFWLEERARRLVWRRATRLVFHTEFERSRFAARFAGRRGEERVIPHGDFFVPSSSLSPADARSRLGVRADNVALVCIGFISPHKGWDRAIRAADLAAVPDLELHLIGSPIRPTPDIERHAEELRRLASISPHATFDERFVSDEEFDLWVRGADAVVIPYRSSSSSGVIARAHLLGTPVITSGVGGLAEQVSDGDLRFSSDAELVEAIRAAARLARSPG